MVKKYGEISPYGCDDSVIIPHPFGFVKLKNLQGKNDDSDDDVYRFKY